MNVTSAANIQHKFTAIKFGRNRFVISLVFTNGKKKTKIEGATNNKKRTTTTTLINLDEIALCAGLGVD